MTVAAMTNKETAPRIVRVKLADIHPTWFVREGLDESRRDMLADLYTSDVKVDNIILGVLVTDPDGIEHLVDGRHRKAALEYLEVKETDAEVRDFLTKEEMIAFAYRQNTGGPLPPTRGDTEHTIRMLLNEGLSQSKITDLIPLPKSLVRRYVKDIASKETATRVRQAAALVTEKGYTVPRAAKECSVDEKRLRDELRGRTKVNLSPEGEFARLKSAIVNEHRSVSLKNGNRLRKALQKFRDGEMPERVTRQLIDETENAIKRMLHVVVDSRRRFEDAVGA